MNKKIKNMFNAFIGAFGVTVILTVGISLFFELVNIIFCLMFIGPKGLNCLFTLKDVITFLVTPPALFLLILLLLFLTTMEYHLHYKNSSNKSNVDNSKYHARHAE